MNIGSITLVSGFIFICTEADVNLSRFPQRVNENSKQTFICTYNEEKDVQTVLWRVFSTAIGTFPIKNGECEEFLKPNTSVYSYNCSVSERTYNLTILNVTRANTNENWTCTIFLENKAIISNIMSPEIIINTISSFTLNGVNDNVTLEENETLVLVCTFDTNAESTLTLQHDGIVLRTQTNTTRLEHSINQITCTDTGRYACVGRTPDSTVPAMKSNMVFVRCRPYPPTEYWNTEKKATDTSATIQWKTGFNNGLARTFVIQFKKKGTHAWSFVNLPEENTNTSNAIMEYTFEGLASGTCFEVILFARNTFGNSEPTYVFEVCTKESKDSQAAVVGATVGAVMGFALVVSCLVAGVFFFRRIRQRKAMNSGNFQEQPTENTTNTYMELQLAPKVADSTEYNKLDFSEDDKTRTEKMANRNV